MWFVKQFRLHSIDIKPKILRKTSDFILKKLTVVDRFGWLIYQIDKLDEMVPEHDFGSPISNLCDVINDMDYDVKFKKKMLFKVTDQFR